jgi:hypothetical protein
MHALREPVTSTIAMSGASILHGSETLVNGMPQDQARIRQSLRCGYLVLAFEERHGIIFVFGSIAEGFTA